MTAEPLDLAALGIGPPEAGADPQDPAVALWWLVTMARIGDATDHPSADRAALARLEAALAERPARDEALGQLHVDPASCLRRADAVASAAGDGPILAVGDDDGVTVALRQAGRAVHAVDLDAELLAWLARHGVATTRADVLASSVPAALRGAFAAVVTDPFRDLDGGLGFLSYAAACVREGGALLWVDHPAWNFEHAEVRRAMAALGWETARSHPALHRYPVPAAELAPVAEAFPAHAEAIRSLAGRAAAWSDLYELRRAARA